VWQVPARYNMGVDVCDKWAGRDPSRLALAYVAADGKVDEYSFDRLRRCSNRLAHVLRGHGVARGDRVGLVLPQWPEAAFGQIAGPQVGGISVRLFRLVGAEALGDGLRDSGASCAIPGAWGSDGLAALRAELPALRHVFCIDRASSHGLD